MSDEEERKLWRAACEQAPDVVRWVETRLRREVLGPPQVQIPRFDHTYSITHTLSAYSTGSFNVVIPLWERGPDGYPTFNVVGMSLFVNGLDKDNLKALGMLEMRIRLWPEDRIIEQPTSVLLVPHTDPPFKPGWLVNMQLPPASTVIAEITNVSVDAMFRFAVHGSFMTLPPF